MQHIIAMGGGGFSMEPENLLLDRYVLAQSPAARPKVCFVPTASGDAEGYIKRFYDAFAAHDCEPSHLSLFKLPTVDLADFVLDKDIVYVGGGNTKNLIALWKEWGLDQIMRQAWTSGVVLAGISAGSICWFEEGLTDSYPGRLDRLDCLGLLPGSNSPHYNGEIDRRPNYQQLIAANRMKSGYAADDGVALHFIGTELKRVVSSRPQAKGYYVYSRAGQAVEEPLETFYLGEQK